MIPTEKIVDKITENLSGGTVRFDGGEVPATGYMVGHGEWGVSAPAMTATRTLISEVVTYLTDTLRVRYIGWWTDPETGRFFLEPSDWTADYNHAVALGAERGELAFFDIASGQDVRLDHAA